VLASKVLVEEGVQVIELCGGFDENMTRRIIDAIGGAVPVAAVAYFRRNWRNSNGFLKRRNERNDFLGWPVFRAGKRGCQSRRASSGADARGL
jgi:hypothetical protein